MLTGFYTPADTATSQTDMQTAVNNYYAALDTTRAWYESYTGTAANNVHGYDNKSFPKTDTLQNYLTATYYDNYDFLDLFNAPAFDYHPGELTGQEEDYFPRVVG